MTALITALLYGIGICAVWQWQIGKRDRELRYLRALAGSKSLWNTRCDVCTKPLRDRPTATDTTVNADGSKTSISYHLWGGCAEIVRNREDRPTA
ncbi:hypothetical protein [Streptomyces xanthophaeus]|uniref:hypothetical protein n=1 Tax=Streptomyces xanthophaeus TaxID=67385 RepID=UPI003718F939